MTNYITLAESTVNFQKKAIRKAMLQESKLHRASDVFMVDMTT